MEYTRDDLARWFNVYFADVRKNQAALETVPELKKYFAPDLEFMMYTSPSPPPVKPISRDALLMSFVHPGLFEDIAPRYYVIDAEKMIAVVQFEIRFRDEPSGRKWDPLQASAHYHLVIDGGGSLKIRKIHYWTEALPPDLFEIWARRREEALTKHAMNFIQASAPN